MCVCVCVCVCAHNVTSDVDDGGNTDDRVMTSGGSDDAVSDAEPVET